jgi:hypothetical protein
MSARAIVSGVLFKAPVSTISKAGKSLSEFGAAVLEEVLNTPLSELSIGDQRICTEAQWSYGPTVGNA